MRKLIPLGLMIATLASSASAVDAPLKLGDLRPQARLDSAAAGFSRLDAPVVAVLLSTDADAQARRSGFRVQQGAVQLEIVADPAAMPDLAAWLQAAGATGVSWFDDLLEAWVPVHLLASLNENPAVRWVRRPAYAVVPEPGLAPSGEPLKVAVISEALPPPTSDVARRRIHGRRRQGRGHRHRDVRVGET